MSSRLAAALIPAKTVTLENRAMSFSVLWSVPVAGAAGAATSASPRCEEQAACQDGGGWGGAGAGRIRAATE
jgi:hypothetical protein